MIDNLIYSLIFVLMGLVAILWSKGAPKTKVDPFFTRITFISGAIFCFLAALYLLFKYFANE